MSRKELELKRIAKNLGVECTGDDNRVCEVLCKIADEMPLIAGEKVTKMPLKIDMDLSNQTLYFDTSKTIPDYTEQISADCQIPGLHILIDRNDQTGIVELVVRNEYGFTETIYEGGTWYKDHLDLTGQQGGLVITRIDERINEYVSVSGVEKGICEKVNTMELYEHNFDIMYQDNEDSVEVRVKYINSQSKQMTFDEFIEVMTNNVEACGVRVNFGHVSVGMMYCGELYYYDGEQKVFDYYRECVSMTDDVRRLI